MKHLEVFEMKRILGGVDPTDPNNPANPSPPPDNPDASDAAVKTVYFKPGKTLR